ncbi:hypothetical protein AL013_07060 [Mariprofundus ferrooxydans]|nr:hypothetical protein AL013_07060 [Mariprofundus ferrooxydans]
MPQSGSTKPPGWSVFLEKLKTQIPAGTDVTEIDNLISKEKYLDAAEIILNKISPADFTRIIRELFVAPRYQPSSIHESILKIDPKIIVTTNYDDIYDSYCRTGMARDGYNICKYYEKHLVADLRSPVRLVVKAHGCVSDPAQIVLSRSQYFMERQNNSTFYSVLDALFITHTLLFIGYSMSDPDIQLVLENSSIAAPSAHPHYAFIQDNISDDIESALAKSYNIQYLKYPEGDHDYANEAIIDLAESVEQFRVTNPI